MQKTVQLSEQEATLRQFLLDVSEYIGTLDGCSRPVLRFTGGWVRDKLLGTGSKDIDIGIDCMTGFKFGTLMNQYLEQPEAQAKYPNSVLGKLAKIAANPEKSKHLETVTTKIMGLEIDLVNLRKETYTEESRNPQMEFGTPEDDALRRDATVNALFYNLDKSEVEDFTGRGLEDMKRGVLKTPLSPYQTFKDDPLRVLRAVRFASRLGYRIDEEDEQAMGDGGIRDALKLKITRERVGIEVTKMLKGPNQHQALQLIDRLGLYHTIFTDFGSDLSESAKTDSWRRAYDQARAFDQGESKGNSSDHTMDVIKSILFRNPDDVYHMWLLCAFVPWARALPPAPTKTKGKASLTPAATAAREGIKADNNTVKLIDSAVMHLDDVIRIKDATSNEIPETTSPLKRKRVLTTREAQGMAIRHWGPSWRSSVMYAILTQITELPIEDHPELLKHYATWLSTLKDLDLLETYQLKPLVTGDKLAKALEEKPGKWMSKALEMVIAWQLRNPDETNPDAAISEVMSRKKDLGLG
ncbi:MAG: hypothetical protein LQ352_001961 [Teloschistes flavicans]|nr:MAG: hypothetical protein LQ352_001961 [Teloschistes flavicans]